MISKETETKQTSANSNTKEKLYKEALGIALSKMRYEQEEVSPQMLNAVVSLLKLDETTLKEKDTTVISNFIKDIVQDK